jgi:hypothetical protein
MSALVHHSITCRAIKESRSKQRKLVVMKGYIINNKDFPLN